MALIRRGRLRAHWGPARRHGEAGADERARAFGRSPRGFLLAGRRSAGRLRLLELGASADLNLRWDLYRYEAGDAAWGDPESPVRLDDCYIGGTPPFHLPARVLERVGCDLNPLDPALDSDRLTLRSLVWPDQENRLAMREAALDLAQKTPARVDREDAAEWLAAQLER